MKRFKLAFLLFFVLLNGCTHRYVTKSISNTTKISDNSGLVVFEVTNPLDVDCTLTFEYFGEKEKGEKNRLKQAEALQPEKRNIDSYAINLPPKSTKIWVLDIKGGFYTWRRATFTYHGGTSSTTYTQELKDSTKIKIENNKINYIGSYDIYFDSVYFNNRVKQYLAFDIHYNPQKSKNHIRKHFQNFYDSYEFQQSKAIIDKNSNHLQSFGKYDDKHNKNGIWKHYFVNQKLQGIKNYKNGVLHGDEKIYFKNGQLKQHSIYENGLLEGKYIAFFDNGNKYTEVNYKNNLKEGYQKWYDKNGVLESQIPFKTGDENGLQTTYYKSGEIHKTFLMSNGQKNGEAKEYFRNGNILKTMTYKFDKLNGQQTIYNQDGSVRNINKYRNGKKF